MLAVVMVWLALICQVVSRQSLGGMKGTVLVVLGHQLRDLPLAWMHGASSNLGQALWIGGGL